jgi:peptidoglycan/xylan/chitin deacetylase (PgdA/CDA1 family)
MSLRKALLVTRSMYTFLNNISKKTATINLTQLVTNGLLIRVGEGKRGIRYIFSNYAKKYAKQRCSFLINPKENKEITLSIFRILYPENSDRTLRKDRRTLKYLITVIEMGIKALYEGTLFKNVRLYNSASQIHHIAQLILRHFKILKNRLFPGTIVLLYHRVINLKTDPQLLTVSPEHFYEHMNFLKNNYNIISLDDLKRAMDSGKLPKKSIIITFDDGYEDNYLNAKPILEQLQIPATIFVTSDHIGSTRELWWDDLERIFLLNETPGELSIKVRDKEYSWKITDKESKMSVYYDMHKLLKPLPAQERNKIVDYLRAWASVQVQCRPLYSGISAEQIKDTEKNGLITVGAHTVSHCMLAALTREQQENEILESKMTLETILNHKVKHFSYPFGGLSDFDNFSVKIVKDAGFDTAVANFCRPVYKGSEFFLPRCLIRNWDIKTFKDKIDGFLYG